MFKDAYKAANDDIRPDPYLLSRILNASEKKESTPFKYFRLAPVAALIALAILLPGILQNPASPTPNVLDQNILPEAKNDTTYYFLNKDTSETKEEPNKTPVPPSESVQQPQVADPVIVMSVNSFDAAPMAVAHSRDLASSLALPMYEVQEITAGEYFERIGFSPDLLALPDGLTSDFDLNSPVCLSMLDGEIVSDENTFVYTGERYLSVTTSTDTSKALTYLENESLSKSIFGSSEVVIMSDGSIYQAIMIHSGGAAIDLVTDMSEDELKNVLISITQ